MKDTRNLWLMAAMGCAVLAVSGCVAYPAHRGEVYAPPPRAPAPGYHQIYRGHDIRYDGRLGVYVVVGLPHYYFYNDYFYRYDRDHWYYSHDLNKRWRPYNKRKLPPGLAKKY